MDAQYQYTNENLQAIVSGMDLQNHDDVLAVGGSGDQAFAILEYSRRVTVIDINGDQIRFIKRRAEALGRGDYEAFLKRKTFEGAEQIGNYFLVEGRLKGIRDNLRGIRIVQGNLLKIPFAREAFSKIYLSNIIRYASRNIRIRRKGYVGKIS